MAVHAVVRIGRFNPSKFDCVPHVGVKLKITLCIKYLRSDRLLANSSTLTEYLFGCRWVLVDVSGRNATGLNVLDLLWCRVSVRAQFADNCCLCRIQQNSAVRSRTFFLERMRARW